MSRVAITLACLALVACRRASPVDGDDSVPNFTPPTVVAHGRCDAPGTSTGFPGGAFDGDHTSLCSFTHEGCAAGTRQEICQRGKSLAFPDCAPTAMVSGSARAAMDEDQGGDGDFVFDIVPRAQAVILDPASTPPRTQPRELRDQASFAVAGGRMHIEVQSCRFCRGMWIFPEQPSIAVDDAIHDGDLVAASGNWTADLPQHEGWSEIHEATAIARVRTLGDAVSYILVNAFFVDSPDQRQDLVLDVPVPPPAQSTIATTMPMHLACEVDPPLLQRGCPCATPPGVMVTAIPDDGGVCHVRIHRAADAPAPLPFACVNTPPCDGKPFYASPATCANVFYGGAIRASWSP